MTLRQTRTFAILEVSPSAYAEITEKLKEAGYDHCFYTNGDEVVIDMHGIAVAEEEPKDATAPAVEEVKLPTSHWEAQAMVRVGQAWLKEHDESF
jgi:hypothetical protein